MIVRPGPRIPTCANSSVIDHPSAGSDRDGIGGHGIWVCRREPDRSSGDGDGKPRTVPDYRQGGVQVDGSGSRTRQRSHSSGQGVGPAPCAGMTPGHRVVGDPPGSGGLGAESRWKRETRFQWNTSAGTFTGISCGVVRTATVPASGLPPFLCGTAAPVPPAGSPRSRRSRLCV